MLLLLFLAVFALIMFLLWRASTKVPEIKEPSVEIFSGSTLGILARITIQILFRGG